MGRIYRRGRTWHAYWTDAEGIAHRQSLRTGDRVAAQARLRALEAGTAARAAQSAYPLKEALGALLDSMTSNATETVDSYASKGKHLLAHLGAATPIASLTRAQVTEYIKARIEAGAHPHTVHKETVVLRCALEEARERGLWTGDARSIVPTVKTHYVPRDRWLTPAEVDGLLAALPAERRLWVGLAVYAGLRDSEVERLDWTQVDLERGELRAPGKKTKGAWRLIPIAPQLAAMLRAARPDLARGPVVAPWGNVRRALPRALRRAQHGPVVRRAKGVPAPPMPTCTPNDLRRTFASWLVQAGVAHLTVAHLLGHTSARMVERVYGHLSRATYRTAIDQAFGSIPCTPAAHEPAPTVVDDIQARKIRKVS
jgi:integrase